MKDTEILRRFRVAFLLMTVIPVLICAYLLLARFGSIDILLGFDGIYFLFVILFAIIGLESGRKLLFDVVRRLAATTEELTLYRDHLEEVVRERTTKLEAAQLGLLQTARYESVSRLAAGIAHEVRNPLSVIMQGVDLMTSQVSPENKEAAEILGFMRDSVRRADVIIRSLSDYASPTELSMKPENLNTVIRQALFLVNYELAKSQVKVVEELSPQLPVIPVDALKLQQVFINLFMNAVQAMTGRGTITVRTYRQEDGTARGPIVAEVEDTGSGISEENLARIFEPFFTTKAPSGSPGLGLTVSRKIMEMHGGDISLQNKDGGGVKVTITLGDALKGGKTDGKKAHFDH